MSYKEKHAAVINLFLQTSDYIINFSVTANTRRSAQLFVAFNQSPNQLQDCTLQHAEEDGISEALLCSSSVAFLVKLHGYSAVCDGRQKKEGEKKKPSSTPSLLFRISHASGGRKAVIFQKRSLFCLKLRFSNAAQVHISQMENKQSYYLNHLQHKSKEYKTQCHAVRG